jgi:transglutaminase-like putative cysteine protease
MILLLLLCGKAHGGAVVYLGKQEARYLLKGPPQAAIPSYSNLGYAQRVEPATEGISIVVATDLAPLRSGEAARPLNQLPPQLAGLAHSLGGQRTLAGQVAQVISWLNEELAYDLGDSAEDPLLVLERRRGNCIGFCNLFQMIMAQLDVPTRYATGIAFRGEDQSTLTLKGNILHRWVEVYYRDVGWVFSDPTGRVNHVEASYVLLGLEELNPPTELMRQLPGASIELLHFRNGLWPALVRQGLNPRIRLRGD